MGLVEKAGFELLADFEVLERDLLLFEFHLAGGDFFFVEHVLAVSLDMVLAQFLKGVVGKVCLKKRY